MPRVAQSTPEVEAARDGRDIEKWINGKTSLGVGFAVLTDAEIVYNIPAGKQVIVTRLCYALLTNSDTMGTYLVSCDAVDGGGNATAMTHECSIITGAANTGKEQNTEELHPPICLKYSAGVRSISIAAKANDANAIVMLAWHGWYEDENTLS